MRLARDSRRVSRLPEQSAYAEEVLTEDGQEDPLEKVKRQATPAWTSGARDELARSTDSYCYELKRLSQSLAAAARLTRVSPVHVEMAREQLRIAGRPRGRFKTAVGGILVGVSLPNLLMAIASGDAIGQIGFVYVVLLVFSSFLIGGEMRRRF